MINPFGLFSMDTRIKFLNTNQQKTMAAQAGRTVTYTARMDWHVGPGTIKHWNEYLARVVKVFGLPGDRYTTHVDADYMDFIFTSEADRLMFLTAWPAHIPDSTPYLLPPDQ